MSDDQTEAAAVLMMLKLGIDPPEVAQMTSDARKRRQMHRDYCNTCGAKRDDQHKPHCHVTGVVGAWSGIDPL